MKPLIPHLTLGLRPISFITIASPHLGVRNYCVAPRMLQKLLYGFSGRTIKELFLVDRGKID